MPRSVVPLPPVIVTKPSTPSSTAWSIVLNVRESSRPESAASSFEPISGRAADHAARNSAARTAGISFEPSSIIRCTWSSGTSRSSGSSTRPRAGAHDRERALRHDDVAVARAVQAVDHHVAEAPAHREHHAGRGPDRHVDAGHPRDLLGPRAGRVHHDVGVDPRLAAGHQVAHRRAGHGALLHDQARHVDVVQELGAVRLRGREEAQRHPHRVHRGVGHAHGGLQLRVQVGLQAQGLLAGSAAGRGSPWPRSPRGSRAGTPCPRR